RFLSPYVFCSLTLIPLVRCTFFFDHAAPPVLYALSLHDALPISTPRCCAASVSTSPHGPASVYPPTSTTRMSPGPAWSSPMWMRSEEHTSELQSRFDLVCRLLLEKKKNPHNRRPMPAVINCSQTS